MSKVDCCEKETLTVENKIEKADDISLKKYRQLARAVIRKSTFKRFLRDEEAVSYVMEEMMMAVERYIPGVGSIYGYLMSRGEFAIRNYFRRWYTIKERDRKIFEAATVKLQSDYRWGVTEPNFSILNRLIYNERRNEAERLIDETDLTEKELEYTKLYLDNMSTSEIARTYGITNQAVHSRIITAAKKLRKRYRELYDN